MGSPGAAGFSVASWRPPGGFSGGVVMVILVVEALLEAVLVLRGGGGCRGRHGRSAVLLVSLLGHLHWHNLQLFIASATQLFEAHADVRAREGLHLAVTGSPTTGEYAENNHPQVDIHRLGPRSSRGTDASPCCAVQTCVRESNLLLPVHTVECYLRSFGCLLESTPVHKMLANSSNCTSRCFCIMLHVGE